MNNRMSGVIIAVSGAVAGALLPSAVQAYVAGQYLTSLGLALIVFLNGAIALLHILDRGKPLQAQESAEAGASPRVAAARRAADPSVSAELDGNGKRTKSSPPVTKADTPSVTLVPDRS